MLRHAAFSIAILALFAGVMALNVRPFLRAKPEIRMKDLSFLPSPQVVRFLAIGHFNSAQRLRWIDSFSYLQLQFDRRDDAVSGGGHGFSRLYDGLIALDDRFIPVFHQAAVSVNGIAERPMDALGYLQRGLLTNPQDFSLWQHAAAILVTDFNAEERDPQQLDAFLGHWATAMEDESHRTGVWHWQAAMARRRALGLTQIGYWQERLQATSVGSPMADYIETVLREQLAQYGCGILQNILEARQAAGLPVEQPEDLLDRERLAAANVHAQLGPVMVHGDGSIGLRSDPWGWPYVIADGEVQSVGIRHERVRRQLSLVNRSLALEAQKRGRWPASLEDVADWGIGFPPLAEGLSLEYGDRLVELVTGVPPHEPWLLRPSSRSASSTP